MDPEEARVLNFAVEATSGSARAGALSTARGRVATPAFMPVATQAAVKALTPAEVSAAGFSLLISNTYHLWLRPGAERIADLGGVHAFMRWPGMVATDSGGFQAFSLAERTRLTEDGFEFSSHLDGTRMHLSPEESMRVQGLLGSDIAMQLDVCPAAGASRHELVEAVERTTRWAHRCLEAKVPDQALFGIVQGGTDLELRLQHIEELSALPLDGIALGGFSVGEPPAEMHAALPAVVAAMDAGRPRYLMGVGTPLDLLVAVRAGVDLFDCVIPTRNGRNGHAFVPGGRIVVKNARYRDDSAVLDAECPCPACAGGFSRAYLRHLYVAGEILAHRLLTLHNLYFYERLMNRCRVEILAGTFEEWCSRAIAEIRGEADS